MYRRLSPCTGFCTGIRLGARDFFVRIYIRAQDFPRIISLRIRLEHCATSQNEGRCLYGSAPCTAQSDKKLFEKTQAMKLDQAVLRRDPLKTKMPGFGHGDGYSSVYPPLLFES